MLALVTGAGIRVGRAVAEALAVSGYDLLLHANRSRAGADEVASEARALGRKVEVVTADLGDPGEVRRLGADLRARHPRLDVIVHNAGLFERVPFGEITLEQYRRMMAVNLDAPFFLTQALLPSLQAAEDPCVVHLADIAGERPVPRYAHYAASKAGLIMLTRALAVELGPRVRVNAVSPGTVAFPEDFDEKARAGILGRVPLGREGTPADAAEAVLYLTRARYVTGQVLAVDGGRSAVL
jgi:pteridine reductase